MNRCVICGEKTENEKICGNCKSEAERKKEFMKTMEKEGRKK